MADTVVEFRTPRVRISVCRRDDGAYAVMHGTVQIATCDEFADAYSVLSRHVEVVVKCVMAEEGGQ